MTACKVLGASDIAVPSESAIPALPDFFYENLINWPGIDIKSTQLPR